MDEFIEKMPKIELHAHLNGSLSDATLKKLIELKQQLQHDCNTEDLSEYYEFNEDTTLEESFKNFAIGHKLVDTQEAVKLATENVIDEFSKENVIYLELRSTPRKSNYMSKENYLNAIVNQIISCRKTHPEIIVKYLPSINISYGREEGEINFKLVSELRKKHPDVVVGLDLSGDPSKGKFSDYREIFERARAEGFRIALHVAEIKNDDEILSKIEFLTSDDRIGHGTFIEESNPSIWKLFTLKQLPVEICLTSNVLCRSVPSYEDHHIAKLIQIRHPIMICTDDFGVYRTSLTREFKICAEVYGLGKAEIIQLTENANKFSFARPSERQLIGDKIEAFKKTFSH